MSRMDICLGTPKSMSASEDEEHLWNPLVIVSLKENILDSRQDNHKQANNHAATNKIQA